MSTEDEQTHLELGDQRSQEVCDSATRSEMPCQAALQVVKKRVRRGGKRYPRNHPYEQTKEDKDRRDRLSQEKAVHKYQKLIREGRPGAPLNSTQFLIADHGTATPQIVTSPKHHTRYMMLSGDSSLSEGEYEDSDGEIIPGAVERGFFERDFAQAYNEYSMEEINGYSREKLVTSCIELRSRVDDLERCLSQTEKECQRLQQENTDLLATLEAWRQSSVISTAGDEADSEDNEDDQPPTPIS